MNGTGENESLEVQADIEGSEGEAVQAAWDGYIGEPEAASECVACNVGDTVWDIVHPGLSSGTFDKNIGALVKEDAVHAAIAGIEGIDCNVRHCVAGRKGLVSYGGDAAWDCDRGQTGAAPKSLLANIRYAVRNRDVGKPLATPKR